MKHDQPFHRFVQIRLLLRLLECLALSSYINRNLQNKHKTKQNKKTNTAKQTNRPKLNNKHTQVDWQTNKTQKKKQIRILIVITQQCL